MSDAAAAAVTDLTDDELRLKVDNARQRAGLTNSTALTQTRSGGPGTVPPRSEERPLTPSETRSAQCVGCGSAIEQRLVMTSDRLAEATRGGYGGRFVPEPFYEPKRCVACAAAQLEEARMNRISNLLRGLTAAGVPLRVLFD